jgi:hypothetical protein
VPLSCNLGTLTPWNNLGHSRPVTGLLYLLSGSHYLKRDLTIFHHNIRGTNNKTDETVNKIVTNPPHVLYFTDHLKTYQLYSILFPNYKLGAKFCGKIYRNGGSAHIFTNPFNSLM